MLLINHKIFEITEIREEGKDVRTFLFDKDVDAVPGQFVIAWIPNVAEKPFSLSYINPLGITVKKRKLHSSVFTPALFELEEGGKVWIRGPYGNGFPIDELHYSQVYILGGGIGSAPLALLAEKIESSAITNYLGADSYDELIFEDRFEKVGTTHIATKDGSKGEKGIVTDLFKRFELRELSSEQTISLKYSKAAICGPEKMLLTSAQIVETYLNPNNIHISLERYMKCGRGLCGSCEFGGYRICVDGPVMSYDQIKTIKDFGNFKKDRAGKKDDNL